MDLESEQIEPGRHIEIELEDEAEQTFDQGQTGDPEPGAEVVVDLAEDEPEADDQTAAPKERASSLEDDTEDSDEPATGYEEFARSTRGAEANGPDLAEPAANDQEQEADEASIVEESDDDSKPVAATASAAKDEVVEVLRQDEEAASPDSAIELGDLDFFSAEKDSAIDGADEDLDFLSDDDEAATKLDLAYAYQKMGDVDGAKEILEEVINEGNDAQISEARNLMQALRK